MLSRYPHSDPPVNSLGQQYNAALLNLLFHWILYSAQLYCVKAGGGHCYCCLFSQPILWGLVRASTAAVSVHGSNWKRLPPARKGLRHLWKNFHVQKSKIAQMVRGQVFKHGKRQSSDRFGEKVARDFSTQITNHSNPSAKLAVPYTQICLSNSFQEEKENTNFTVEHKSDLWHKGIFSLCF